MTNVILPHAADHTAILDMVIQWRLQVEDANKQTCTHLSTGMCFVTVHSTEAELRNVSSTANNHGRNIFCLMLMNGNKLQCCNTVCCL